MPTPMFIRHPIMVSALAPSPMRESNEAVGSIIPLNTCLSQVVNIVSTHFYKIHRAVGMKAIILPCIRSVKAGPGRVRAIDRHHPGGVCKRDVFGQKSQSMYIIKLCSTSGVQVDSSVYLDLRVFEPSAFVLRNVSGWSGTFSTHNDITLHVTRRWGRACKGRFLSRLLQKGLQILDIY